MQTFTDLKRNLKKDFSGLRTVKIGLVGDSATQLLHQALRGYGYTVGYNLDIHEADYDQIDLQLFDPRSDLYTSSPDFVVIFQSVNKLSGTFYKLCNGDKARFAENQIDYVRRLYHAVREHSSGKVIHTNFPVIFDGIFGNYAGKIETSLTYQLHKLNLGLMDLARECSDLFICDLEALQSHYGHSRVHDPKLYINASMVVGLDFLPVLARQMVSIIQAVSGTFAKCLIVDLDNTLWGGVIGDDGLENIHLGELGIGKAYNELQLWIKQLKQRGIILAVCSKNTESIAREPFEQHPDMVLKLEDIAVFVANWETKVDNIRYIRDILNIGFDSMVFLDDNPFEREMVKKEIPEIIVPDLPEDPAEYLLFLQTLNLFETASYTEEDNERTRQYQEEAKRSILQRSFDNEDDFLKSLEMSSLVQPFDSFNIPRVAQLTQRSNQFNLRTIRYTQEQVQAIAASDDYLTMTFTLEDRFGDHGLISVIILKKQQDALFIDTWIMSCRVLKRGMEYFTLNRIVDLARHYRYPRLVGEYMPTRKNGLVKDHFSSLGFREEDGVWIMDVDSYKEKPCNIERKG